MDIIRAVLLGIIQGLTEYLPISSSGHLQLFHSILGSDVEENLFFDVLLHVATCCSTICVYYKQIGILVKDSVCTLGWNDGKKYILTLLISCVPVFVVGVFMLDAVEKIYEGNIFLLGSCFVFTALCLLVGRYIEFHTDATHKKESVGYKNALLIGIAQAIAVLPGVSRSGLTISTGMMCKIDKRAVTSFSFLMVLIPVFGKVFLDSIKIFSSGNAQWHSIDLLPSIFGFVTAFVVGYFSCKWMIKLIKEKSLSFFAYYCLILGICVLVYGFCKG